MPPATGQSSTSTSLLTIVKAQIVFLLSTLSEDNWQKNRDEIRALIDGHGVEPRLHFIRKLISSSQPLLSPSAATNTAQSANQSPQPALVLRLLAAEVKTYARDPTQAEVFRDAVADGGDLKSFSLLSLFARDELRDLTALEKFVIAVPFLSLLLPGTPNAKRTGGAEAATVIKSNLPKLLEQLERPAQAPGDLPDLSPLPISKILSLVLSDLSTSDNEQDTAFTDQERKVLVSAVVRGRLGTEVGAQVLSHASETVTFASTPSVIAAISRLAPMSSLCTIDLVKAVLSRFGPDLSGEGAESHVLAILTDLISLAARDAELANAVDLAVVVSCLHEANPALRWGDVVKAYDDPSVPLPEGWGLRIFSTFLSVSPAPPPRSYREGPVPTLISQPGGSAAVSALWSSWKHPAIQFALIGRLLYLPIETFSLASLPAQTRAVTNEDLPDASQATKALAANAQASPWNIANLSTTLLKLSELRQPDLTPRIHELLDRGSSMSPDLILISLAMQDKPWSQTHSQIVSRLTSMVLHGQGAATLAFARLHQIDSSYVLETLQGAYQENETNVTKVVDIAHEAKALDALLETKQFPFALDVAAYASRREFINLEKWLSTAVTQDGETMVRATLEFVGRKVKHDLQRQALDTQPEPATISLSATTVAVFLRVLRSHHELFTGNDVELFKEVRTQCLQLYPRLMNFSPGMAEREPGMSVVSFSPEIEAECDALYKRMYDDEIPVDRVVDALQRAKKSDNSHDHEFLACFLHGLFDEHRFFNTYPPKELALTAQLFGDLIQYQLIDFIPLGIAVRYVLDALRNPPNSNWFRFGIQALARFQSRLAEWPQLANSILAIPHVAESHPDIAAVAQKALSQREGGETNGFESADVADMGHGLDQKPEEAPEPVVFTAISVDSADDREPEAPDEETSDKILFIVNNLAPTNFDSKVSEMSTRITAPLHAWFAQYLVGQRISIEPNNHGLYMNFLDALALPPLNKRVLHETYKKLVTLLNAEKTVQSSTERTLLKNLGAWLGALTLAKDKPIKQRNIAFKDLLIQGYDGNRLIVAIPFVCKVLEQCSKSRVFKPPNPWLMGIVRLLVELYQYADLKLNLKFEIEVLCKSLNIDLKQIEPTDTLRTRPVKEAPVADMPLPPAAPEVEEAVPPLSRSFAAPPGVHPLSDRPQVPSLSLGSGQQGFSLSLQDTISAALQNLPNHVSFSPQVPLFATNPTLKRIVFVAIDRAIREIIAPVVERSVTIAGISTRELTMKDFAMEGDEGKMATAAHLMVQNLAGSLALVTCKEPLRISMVTHIRNLMLQNGFTEQTIPDQAILVVVADNLDLACGVVEKVAMEKAIVEVDEGLAPAYLSRRTHRERSREAFWDTSAMAASHYSGMLPDPLRLKLGGLQPQQLRVYEDFASIRNLQAPLTTEQQRNGAVGYTESPVLAAAQQQQPALSAPVEMLPPAVPASAAPVSGQQAMDRFSVLIKDLEEAILAEGASTAAARLRPESNVRTVMQQIPLLAASSINRDEIALACSQKIVQLLYRSEGLLAREVYVALLERLCSMSAKTTKEVTAWLIYADDERKFNVPVTIALCKARIINITELDAQLAKFILREFRPSVVDFVSRLASECLIEVPPVASREQLAHSLEALAQANRVGKGTEASRHLLQEVRGTAISRSGSPGKTAGDSSGIRDQLTLCFAEWVRLYQQSYSVEKSFVDFVLQLQNQGILKGEEISSMFFRVCTEVSVESYVKHKAQGGSPATGIFQPVDAFAKLIVFMIKYHADPTGANNDKAKVHYMTKVLSIVVLVLANTHEQQGAAFQPKPFFRFFSSLLSNLHSIETHLGTAYHQILIALSQSFHTLQPLFFPGFAFSWMTLISHRLFMPKLLAVKEKEGWLSFHRQLVALMRFLGPFIRRGRMSDVVRQLYLGTERIMLVLLHDYPTYLSQTALALADAVPPEAVQLLNILTSAFPTTGAVHLPDPLTPGLKVDTLAEASIVPTSLIDPATAVNAIDLRKTLTEALSSKDAASYVDTILSSLVSKSSSSGTAGAPAGDSTTKWNFALLNSTVSFIGISAVEQQGANGKYSADSSAAVLLREMVAKSDPEGRYYVLSSMCNHLRWPNSDQVWFTSCMLSIFELAATTSNNKRSTSQTSDAGDAIREQVTRVLLERVVCNRPHAWGVLYTFAQLASDNSKYGLNEQAFVKKAPEIASLLAQVSLRALLTESNNNGSVSPGPTTVVDNPTSSK